MHAVLEALSSAGCRWWIGGGWGVDALVGAQTRVHRDLDLVIEAADETAALAVLARRGYAVATDWRPVRVEVAAAGGGRVDLHPVTFDEHGDAVQSGLDGAVFRYPARSFVSGTIDGREVGCLSVEQQLVFHSGYELRPVDHDDLAVLRDLQRD